MLALTQIVPTFPSVRLPSYSGGLPVEVALIAQLSPGSGDALIARAMTRQQGHDAFVDALDEPSARLGGMDLAKGDTTSLYTFGVGAKGHPFHRHAGHRVFTAISGSGGAQLRFSSASPAQLARDPRDFLRALRHVEVPPDCLFTVRFGGETWHQFAPLKAKSPHHPALFALSCHTNELGGNLPDALRAQVLANDASIPALTELLPSAVQELLDGAAFDARDVPTIALALDAPAGAAQSRFCAAVRSTLGRVRAHLARWRGTLGFRSESGPAHVESLAAPAPDSLLATQFTERCEYSDVFALRIDADGAPRRDASAWLALLLDGFLQNRPLGVSRLMRLRNVLVAPLGLRTSPLGCPVSSLLCAQPQRVFAERFPVLDARVDADGRRAQVLLGADDKHLRFRSCVSAELRDGHVVFTLGTRVQCKNLFGRFYMAAIERTHRGYVAPAMLRLAADWALAQTGANLPVATIS